MRIEFVCTPPLTMVWWQLVRHRHRIQWPALWSLTRLLSSLLRVVIWDYCKVCKTGEIREIYYVYINIEIRLVTCKNKWTWVYDSTLFVLINGYIATIAHTLDSLISLSINRLNITLHFILTLSNYWPNKSEVHVVNPIELIDLKKVRDSIGFIKSSTWWSIFLLDPFFHFKCKMAKREIC